MTPFVTTVVTLILGYLFFSNSITVLNLIIGFIDEGIMVVLKKGWIKILVLCVIIIIAVKVGVMIVVLTCYLPLLVILLIREIIRTLKGKGYSARTKRIFIFRQIIIFVFFLVVKLTIEYFAK